MGKITLELGDEQNAPFPCSCCGKLTHSSYGYLYSDGSAHAVYFARWTEGHDHEANVTMLISMGEWGTDVPRPGGRACMGLRAWLRDGGVVYTVLDAADTPWGHRGNALGSMLSREQALAHPGKAEFFRLAEHVTGDDPSIWRFLHPQS